jgi:phytoene dehydrogenase-like protein
MSKRYDAIIVGGGPNGLAAAIELARAGRTTLLLEAEATIGGGSRSAEVTLPGFVHDICSAIHPLGVGSPFMRTLPLTEHGLQWVYPKVSLAHPLDDGTAVVLQRSVAATAATLGRDANRYYRLVAPLVRNWQAIVDATLRPLVPPRRPFTMARFGLRALWPATLLARAAFREERTRALFAGLASHAIMPLEKISTAAFGFVLLMLGHAVGWPFPQGGSQKIPNAMASYLRSLGGEIQTGVRVDSLSQLPDARAVLFDVTPRQLLSIAGDRLPQQYQNALQRYRYGPGVFKVDWALDGPIPWTADECRRTATVHVGGTLDEIAASERASWNGQHVQQPFVLVAQHTLFDATRAPKGKHTAWGYCHVPNGSTEDMTDVIEQQIERFAPGFRSRILARSTKNAVEMQHYNANYIGGDINGGVQDVFQLFMRPVARLDPYSTPASGLYLCSSSTPPGGGVHGMCGYWAARSALRSLE